MTKEYLSGSASDWAQGGIAAAIAPGDSPTLHLEDTLKAGAGLCDRSAVQLLVEHAKDCIENLVAMGVGFDRHGAELALTLEAAHSQRRVLHAADTTGRAVVTALTDQVLSRPNIYILPNSFAIDLWLDAGRCRGVAAFTQQGIGWIQAKAVVLATGGGGQVFAQTTNPDISTGDGVAMAWRAGAVLRDLEFIQFHPTALTRPGAPRFLISEAVRGEGAHLVDADGRRFAFDYHPDGELAPRDVVSRAIFNHLNCNHLNCNHRNKTASDPAIAQVWLDLRPIPADTIRRRFPNIIQVCQTWGVDVFQQPIPVAPAAHYWMGGVYTDALSRTSIPGLYAVGETANTGVHGANRLASNSLLECLVFGAQLTQIELLAWNKDGESLQDLPPSLAAQAPLQQATIHHIRHALPRLMWQSAGICRDAATLSTAIAQVQQWRKTWSALPFTQFWRSFSPGQGLAIAPGIVDASIRSWGELGNLLDIALLILQSAHFRTESRGGHYRSDVEKTDPHWQVHTVVQGDQWSTAPPH